ncbi:MAG TPA: hypothetical protein PL110_12620 [Candidatus Eremiobacteraeota bacterium]|nr:MAG: hypothetical protein BWY64_03526 [bacterium ADurb.Bin363]HPZ08955.1 hypothetical protein [Candidatus Eremiobacteraeota bacterium]
MARDGWFDQKGDEIYLAKLKGIRKYLLDNKITPDEVAEQHQKIYDKMKQLEPKLSDELHAELTDILYEYELLVAMVHLLPPARRYASCPHCNSIVSLEAYCEGAPKGRSDIIFGSFEPPKWYCPYCGVQL